nr:DUF4811 domain-containing protein [Lentilactobacillus senioris]
MLIGIGVVLILILIGYLFHRKWKFRSIIISVSLILLAVVSYLIATNHQNHYGMHVFIDSSGSMLYSPIANHPRILLYDDGAPNNQKRVYYFKQYPNQPTISKTDSQATITKVTIIEQPASLVTKTGTGSTIRPIVNSGLIFHTIITNSITSHTTSILTLVGLK